MNNIKSSEVIGNDAQPTIKAMAYGGATPISSTIIASNLYRLRRGFPYPRRGTLVNATPQFKALTIYSPTSKNAQLPGATVTPVSIAYPRKAV